MFGLWLPSLLAQAKPATVAPGEYLMAGGRGTLQVAPQAADGQKFSIASLGINGHSCSLDGVMRNLRAEVEAGKGEPPCVVEFATHGSEVEVTPKTADICRQFCGVRASFDGTYGKAAAGCAGREVKNSRAAFKLAYAQKDYARAQSQLAPLLASCRATLYEVDEANIRNDLAVTLFHLGRPAECLAMLKDLESLAQTTDEELRDQYSYAPSEAEQWLPIARATRTNLRLCGAGRGK